MNILYLFSPLASVLFPKKYALWLDFQSVSFFFKAWWATQNFAVYQKTIFEIFPLFWLHVTSRLLLSDPIDNSKGSSLVLVAPTSWSRDLMLGPRAGRSVTSWEDGGPFYGWPNI